MWISAGAIRSHMIALVHAITTQPVAITPHQVIKVIATPIGPNPVHPWSNIGKPTRTTAVMTIPSITTPAKPASKWHFQPRPPSRTSNIGVSDQKIHTGTSDTTRCAARTPASCWPVNNQQLCSSSFTIRDPNIAKNLWPYNAESVSPLR